MDTSTQSLEEQSGDTADQAEMGVDGKAGKGEADAANGGHGVAKGCCHVV